MLQHVFVCAGIAYVMIRFGDVVLRGGMCHTCGGMGKHRDDCPDQ